MLGVCRLICVLVTSVYEERATSRSLRKKRVRRCQLHLVQC